MAQSPSTKPPKQKRTLGKLLLPNKIPNKVGVLDGGECQSVRCEQNTRVELCCAITDARRSPLAVSRRPLSLDVSSLSSRDENVSK